MNIKAKPLNTGEKGASTVVALFMILTIFTAFGLGFDIMRNAYLRASLNNDLDMAVTAAASQVYIGTDGQVYIDDGGVEISDGTMLPGQKALSAFRDSYNRSRALYGGLGCFNVGGETCWIEDTFTIKDNVLTVKIVDTANQWWAPFWSDSSEFPIIIESKAVLRNVNEERYGNN
jgi:hypothetical protein